MPLRSLPLVEKVTASPARLVCLSAESADLCARLGAWDRVVGVSAFADQTGLAHKPVVGGFSKADATKIAALSPDLVFTFSDVQAEITAELMREGCTVLGTNPRSLAEIAESIRLIARTVDRPAQGEALIEEFWRELEALRWTPPVRPRVYFEEWLDPMISGIGWVSEIIDLCGGTDVFAHRQAKAARDRTVSSDDVIAAAPEIIFASWCGKPVDLDAIRNRSGWDAVPANQTGRIFEFAGNDILQPGLRLLRGAREISRRLHEL